MFCVLLIIVLIMLLIYLVISLMVFRFVMQPSNKKIFGMNTISPSLIHDSTRIEQVCISSFDNTILSAYLLKNHESKKMVMLIHGYGSSAENMVQYISFFEKRDIRYYCLICAVMERVEESIVD